MSTAFEYHSDELNHGNYQYLPLKQVINEFMSESIDDDDILKNTRRSLIVKRAKEGLRELNKGRLGQVLAIEITVPDTLFFALPHDYVKWMRASVVIKDDVTDSFRLKPLEVNENINTADGYLQDNDWQILFDDLGRILKADSSNAYARPYKKYNFTERSYNFAGNQGFNTSNLSKYGEVKFDEENGKMVFSSNLSDREIVLEYRSDGLASDTYNEGEIRVHKDIVNTLNDYIYWKSIRRKKNVNQSEKRSALLRYKTSRHEAKLDRMNFSLIDFTRTMNLRSRAV